MALKKIIPKSLCIRAAMAEIVTRAVKNHQDSSSNQTTYVRTWYVHIVCTKELVIVISRHS